MIEILKISCGGYYDFYGTQLYGYVDKTNLKSYKYLKQIGKLKGDDFTLYGYENRITLSFMEFAKFIKLYWRELKSTRYFDKVKTDQKSIKRNFRMMSKQPGDKTVWWDEVDIDDL